MRIANYRKMYFDLAARVADAIELLIEAQQYAENQYIEEGDTPPIALAPKPSAAPKPSPTTARPAPGNGNGGTAETS